MINFFLGFFLGIFTGVIIGMWTHAGIKAEAAMSKEQVAEWAYRLEGIVVEDVQVAKEKIRSLLQEIRKKL